MTSHQTRSRLEEISAAAIAQQQANHAADLAALIAKGNRSRFNPTTAAAVAAVLETGISAQEVERLSEIAIAAAESTSNPGDGGGAEKREREGGERGGGEKRGKGGDDKEEGRNGNNKDNSNNKDNNNNDHFMTSYGIVKMLGSEKAGTLNAIPRNGTLNGTPRGILSHPLMTNSSDDIVEEEEEGSRKGQSVTRIAMTTPTTATSTHHSSANNHHNNNGNVSNTSLMDTTMVAKNLNRRAGLNSVTKAQAAAAAVIAAAMGPLPSIQPSEALRKNNIGTKVSHKDNLIYKSREPKDGEETAGYGMDPKDMEMKNGLNINGVDDKRLKESDDFFNFQDGYSSKREQNFSFSDTNGHGNGDNDHNDDDDGNDHIDVDMEPHNHEISMTTTTANIMTNEPMGCCYGYDNSDVKMSFGCLIETTLDGDETGEEFLNSSFLLRNRREGGG
eukprot:CAMPEP_0175047794 /NCGR_PEP_ID=MMETSP0052_2-20121109/5803_1 /TAXON_ID=51329 ORGANISM="Polytomella parva, Strain SAG 63-3" /NCGR_SAMPLE_ID=MMETSP0052_2 /ASSEMBLY_ACC=CAM_ASM_000194 /LENGTH=445 /DNA_ID=CAMNT_0016311729 /DNA_START=371 /DNA_END=1704 /DNA_ORIENTATION=-